MSRIDELYLARMEAESIEQELWERARAHPSDFELQRSHREAVRAAEAAGAIYLDELIEAEALARRDAMVAV
jgi:hypothetical protein